MTVEELIKELESMSQNLPVYIEGEVANKVTLENYQGQGNMYVQISHTFDIGCCWQNVLY